MPTLEDAMCKLNDHDRQQWVDNDEGLYRWWRSTGLSRREFIRQNRSEIDKAVRAMVNGERRSHYLAYGS